MPRSGFARDMKSRCAAPCVCRSKCSKSWPLAFVAWLLPAGIVVVCQRVKRCLHRAEDEPDGAPPGTRGVPPSAGRDRPATGAPQTIPGTIYRKPDPMIYDQYWLMSHGFAVTWDNPDIHLERPLGNPVSSHDLLPSTAYHVVARVWNLSESAAAPRMPVRFSFLRFGIGGGKTTFAEDVVDVPVKAAPGSPVTAVVEWMTPPDAGHYCLQAELIWPADDDANPGNNLGQLNTDVKVLRSPALFTVPVRNDDLRRRRLIRLHVDAYQIPELVPCDDAARDLDPQAQVRKARERHSIDRFPVPAGWTVQAMPSELSLGPMQEGIVIVTATAPDGFRGRVPFNLHAVDDDDQLLGGVTLYVEGR